MVVKYLSYYCLQVDVNSAQTPSIDVNSACETDG